MYTYVNMKMKGAVLTKQTMTRDAINDLFICLADYVQRQGNLYFEVQAANNRL